MKALSLSLAAEQATLLTPTSVAEVVSRPHGAVWIALHFPALALSVCDLDGALPAVVIDQSGGRQTVHAACAVAMDHGIAPGLSLNAAHALCRNLDVRLRDVRAEQRRLKAYSEQLLCFTPTIAPGDWRAAAGNTADSLLLEVSPSLRLYGGLESLLEKIRAEFSGGSAAAPGDQGRGNPARPPVSQQPLVSVAPCPAAALLLSRNGIERIVQDPDSLKSALGAIALRSADLMPALVARLERCGLRNLRDCWRLPREDLGRRFGTALIDYLDRLCAVQTDPLAQIRPPLCFRQRIELPADTRHSRLILIAARKLLEEAHRFLQMHAAAAETICFDLWHVNRAYGSRSRTRITVRSAEADRRPARFMPQLEEQLERTVIDEEVNAVSILVDRVVPYMRSSQDLFERRDRQQQSWGQLLDLLAARLGEQRLYRLGLVADHRPEYAWKRRPAAAATTTGGQGSRLQQQIADYVRQSLPPRPLWLLRQPRPVAARRAGRLQFHGEVERIEAGWWVRDDSRRDYRVAGDEEPAAGAGKACQSYQTCQPYQWLSRHLRRNAEPGVKPKPPQWCVHGLFG